MAYTALVSIGGTPIKDPSEYEANTATIVNSARNTEGKMIGQVIREDVAKVTMTWRFISVKDWADILQMFDKRFIGGDFIRPVTFFNQTVGTWETRNMYVSDRSAKIFKRDINNNIMGYLGARLALIEV